ALPIATLHPPWTQRQEMRRLSALPCGVQRSPCRHSESDCFVAYLVRVGPVFFAMFFPVEHNAPADRALSSSEMGSSLSVSFQRSYAGGCGHPWSGAGPRRASSSKG